MRFRVKHVTEYEYQERVAQCYNLAFLVPRNTDRQQCLDSHIHIEPFSAWSSRNEDYFGNTAFHFEIQAPHERLVITSESEVNVDTQNAAQRLDFGISYAQALELLATSRTTEIREVKEFLLTSPAVKLNDDITAYAKASFSPNRPVLSCVRELTSRIYEDFKYDPEATSVATPLEEVFAKKAGVCQDFAHFEIACLRAMGLPARYVSGYIETLPPPGEEKLLGSDASHAWIAVYSPSEGWYEFDPTNDKLAADQHIITAWGRDYFDVTPLKGVIFGGGESPKLNVSVDVTRIEDAAELI